MTAVSVKLSAFTDDDVAGLVTSSVPKTREAIARPGLAGRAPRRRNTVASPIGLMLCVERAAPVHGIDQVAGRRAGEGGELQRRVGRGKLRRTVRSGGFSIMLIAFRSSVLRRLSAR